MARLIELGKDENKIRKDRERESVCVCVLEIERQMEKV